MPRVKTPSSWKSSLSHWTRGVGAAGPTYAKEEYGNVYDLAPLKLGGHTYYTCTVAATGKQTERTYYVTEGGVKSDSTVLHANVEEARKAAVAHYNALRRKPHHRNMTDGAFRTRYRKV